MHGQLAGREQRNYRTASWLRATEVDCLGKPVSRERQWSTEDLAGELARIREFLTRFHSVEVHLPAEAQRLLADQLTAAELPRVIFHGATC